MKMRAWPGLLNLFFGGRWWWGGGNGLVCGRFGWLDILNIARGPGVAPTERQRTYYLVVLLSTRALCA